MKRRDILLALLYLPDKPGGALAQPIDPVRIMNGLFLFGKGKRERCCTPDFYSFRSYLYAPCSLQVYSDLRALINDGDVDELPRIYRWTYYRLTSKGREKAGQILKELPDDLHMELKKIKRIVASKSFLDLLHYIREA